MLAPPKVKVPAPFLISVPVPVNVPPFAPNVPLVSASDVAVPLRLTVFGPVPASASDFSATALLTISVPPFWMVKSLFAESAPLLPVASVPPLIVVVPL